MEKENYTSDNIKTLEIMEHMRLRPGMYIGRTGNGEDFADGIYILLKETIDNGVDEFFMGEGDTIDVTINYETGQVIVRDYGRGIPHQKMIECLSKEFTGGKYSGDAFNNSIGLNGIGMKAVNALSTKLIATSWRNGKEKTIEFAKGKLVKEQKEIKSKQKNGTEITFFPDPEVFENFKYKPEHTARMANNYACLNSGLTIKLNKKTYYTNEGLKSLLEEYLKEDNLYDIVRLQLNSNIEIAFTHKDTGTEELHSAVNGQYTDRGGTHEDALRQGLTDVFRTHFDEPWAPTDIKSGLLAGIRVNIQDPEFDSQTKNRLSSSNRAPGERLITYVKNSLTTLDNWLHQNPEIAEKIKAKLEQNKKERTELAGAKKAAKKTREANKINNKKLRDCRIHYNTKNKRAQESSIFITEGDSAAGSITKARDAQTQAVFALKGKPKNLFNSKKSAIYKNEEAAMLMDALGVEDGIENLKYRNVIIATDADVDGMHIRLLLLTMLLEFWPELFKGYLYFLETPLFRVRNKKETKYCYSEKERDDAIKQLKNNEITRFKGLGEISPDEFEEFLHPNHIKLTPVTIDSKGTPTQEILQYYMGGNTPERKQEIIQKFNKK